MTIAMRPNNPIQLAFAAMIGLYCLGAVATPAVQANSSAYDFEALCIGGFALTGADSSTRRSSACTTGKDLVVGSDSGNSADKHELGFEIDLANGSLGGDLDLHDYLAGQGFSGRFDPRAPGHASIGFGTSDDFKSFRGDSWDHHSWDGLDHRWHRHQLPPIPEPGTLSLLMLGTAIVGVAAYRRRASDLNAGRGDCSD